MCATNAGMTKHLRTHVIRRMPQISSSQNAYHEAQDQSHEQRSFDQPDPADTNEAQNEQPISEAVISSTVPLNVAERRVAEFIFQKANLSKANSNEFLSILQTTGTMYIDNLDRDIRFRNHQQLIQFLDSDANPDTKFQEFTINVPGTAYYSGSKSSHFR
jgi:hypothetical protein